MFKPLFYRIAEVFWSISLKVYFKGSRIFNHIVYKWYSRKKEVTDWTDVWKYLDRTSKFTRKQSKRSRYLASKRDRCFIKRLDSKRY